MKNGVETLLNFGIRAIFGMIAVWMINRFLERIGMQMAVGINPVSFLTAGVLGMPGVALLYGLRAYFL